MERIVIYDWESLPNFFSGAFFDMDTEKKKEFILFDDIQQLHDLFKFLKRLKKFKYILCGFNVIHYDSQLTELILNEYPRWIQEELTIEQIVSEIYYESQRVINVQDSDRFEELIGENYLQIPHIDLRLQNHYDGKAKSATSLKWLQFTMRYPTVEEMPIPHDAYVTKDQIPMIMGYNWNDVDSTKEFFLKKKYETDLRVTLSEKYGLKLINASEPRMVREIFGKMLCEDMGISYKELKKMRTDRASVAIKDVLFPYINFKTKQLQSIHKAFERLVINVSDRQEFKYEFSYHDVATALGLGGIHACVPAGVYEKDEENIIHDIDVVSFYPNLAIENDLKPEHLGKAFTKIYKMIFEERKKIPKKDPINYIFKIILNSTFGLSMEKFSSYLYDPKFTYGITINGQLTILMLAEMLISEIPSIKILQMNTDGITIRYDRKYLTRVKEIMEEWKKTTRLDLEEAFYKKMIIRDVNNYIAVYDEEFLKPGEKKEPKKKGTFETEMEYHKNPSYLVVPKAIEAYFVHGKDYKKFILDCEDIYDFFGGVKRKSNFDLNLYVTKEGELVSYPQQKVTRFFVSTNGGQLVKDFTDGRKANKVSVVAGYKVTPQNKVEEKNAKNYPIDYQWYIREAEKIIFEIKKNQKQLVLL